MTVINQVVLIGYTIIIPGVMCMILELDMGSDIPIYVQLRNQIVKGIGMKSFRPSVSWLRMQV